MKTLIVIPARYASSRFPGKPLAQIDGEPMIRWVYESVGLSGADAVVVATDDERIANTVLDFGGRVMMTAQDHENGTSRCREVAEKYKEFELVINVQGDEPLIHPSCLQDIICELEKGHDIVSLYHELQADQAQDPDKVKVVLDAFGQALYFSRAPIPYPRGGQADYYQHVGVYGFRREVLIQLEAVSTGKLAKTESLEQLSWLEQGHKVKMVRTGELHFGVDTEQDLRDLEEYIRREGIRLGKPRL